MKKSSLLDNDKSLTRESIIGLGESSFRKNYFPALQKKIADLEVLNSKYRTLIETIPDILLIGNGEELSLFSPTTGETANLVREMLNTQEISNFLKASVEESRKEKHLITRNFSFNSETKSVYFEAKANFSDTTEALIIIRDITSEILSQDQLREMALQDGLTKLYNRRYFEEYQFGYSGKQCENLSVILMDIDGLKIINDTLGHLSGDQMLISFSEILKKTFTKSDCIARVGGDEFGVFLVGIDQDDIELLLKKMNSIIKKNNQELLPISLSVSFGYSYMRSGVPDLSLMYREADNKMYQNKLLKEASNKSSIVKTLMKTLEVKDFITEGHAQRMSEMAERMGRSLSLPQDQLDRIELLTKFHDIGKVGIPDSILKKPGKLNESEWEIMKSHSSIGKRIAEVSQELKNIASLILLHHEQWDGSGYPLGLTAHNIPIECRILSIVDAFDAMTNDRPYRQALSMSEAINEIENCSGTQFDEQLVRTFMGIIAAAPVDRFSTI